MKKAVVTHSILAVAIMAVTSGLAHAEPDFYGRIWLAANHSDNGLISSRGQTGASLENYASFVGVKGSETLTKGIDIIYVMEVGNNGGFYNSSSLFKARNTYLGLATDYGRFMVGRNDTVFKKSEGKVDLFNITSSDMGNLISGNDRLGDTATYYSPSIYGIKFGASYQLVEDNDESHSNNGHYAISLTTGDPKLSKGNYYLALAHADNLNNLDATRAVAGVKLGAVKLGAIYQHSQSQKYLNLKGDSYIASAELPLDKVSLKAQYLYDDSGTGKILGKVADRELVTDTSLWQASLGADYRAAKSTTVSVFITRMEGDVTDNAGYHEFDDTSATLAVKFLF